MNFEILISSMHKDTNQVSEMLASMNISCDAVVIVQGLRFRTPNEVLYEHLVALHL